MALLALALLLGVIAPSSAQAAVPPPAEPPVGTITTYTSTAIDSPLGVALVPAGEPGAGDLWFTSNYNSRVGRRSPDGTITTFTHPGMDGPQSMVFADGAVWFTDDGGGGPSNSHIGRISLPSGDITLFTDPSLDMWGPRGIVEGPDGNLWIISQVNDSLTRFNPGTHDFRNFPIGVDYPHGITAGSDGNLWFTAFGEHNEPGDPEINGRIGRMTPSGEVTLFGTGGIPLVTGIAQGADGRMWFIGFRDIAAMDPVSGEISWRTYGGGISGRGITAGPDGSLWYVRSGGSGGLGRITTEGVSTEFNSPNVSGYTPTLMVPSADGRQLWFASANSDSVGRVQVLAVPQTFTDVPPSHPARTQISWAADALVMSGYPDGTFKPNGFVSRRELVVSLYRLRPRNFYPPPTPTFSDVPTTDPDYPQIEWAAAEGLVGGPTFQPSQRVTRRAAAAFIYRAVDPTFSPPATPTYSDVPTTAPRFTEIEYLAHRRISDRPPAYPNYRPSNDILRHELAKFLYRLAHTADS